MESDCCDAAAQVQLSKFICQPKLTTREGVFRARPVVVPCAFDRALVYSNLFHPAPRPGTHRGSKDRTSQSLLAYKSEACRWHALPFSDTAYRVPPSSADASEPSRRRRTEPAGVVQDLPARPADRSPITMSGVVTGSLLTVTTPQALVAQRQTASRPT